MPVMQTRGKVLGQPVRGYQPEYAVHSDRVGDPTGNHGAEAEDAHGDHHYQRRFAQVHVVADAGGSGFAGRLGIVQLALAAASEFTVEDEVHHAVGVEGGQQHAYQEHDGTPAG